MIADEVWAKLPRAALNLAPADLPGNSADIFYPMELIRAVTLIRSRKFVRASTCHSIAGSMGPRPVMST